MNESYTAANQFESLLSIIKLTALSSPSIPKQAVSLRFPFRYELRAIQLLPIAVHKRSNCTALLSLSAKIYCCKSRNSQLNIFTQY